MRNLKVGDVVIVTYCPPFIQRDYNEDQPYRVRNVKSGGLDYASRYDLTGKSSFYQSFKRDWIQPSRVHLFAVGDTVCYKPGRFKKFVTDYVIGYNHSRKRYIVRSERGRDKRELKSKSLILLPF